MWWKQNKWKVLVPALILAVLAAAFYFGGSAPGLRGWSVKEAAPAQSQSAVASESQTLAAPAASSSSAAASSSASSEQSSSAAETSAQPEAAASASASAAASSSAKPAEETKPAEKSSAQKTTPAKVTPKPAAGMTAAEKEAAAAKIARESGSAGTTEPGDKSYSEQNGMQIDAGTGRDKYQTAPVPAGKPVPVEPQDAVITDKAHTCTLSISCAAILDNMDWLDPDKKDLVPSDGWILKPTQVTFYEGESVFNVLVRTCKQNKIHMEFKDTPIYNSAYIEGIHNLYEFDCGELSGWMYKVNDWFPNYGCSRYALKDGDVVCWEYTCDLGNDVGGGYSSGG
jgi:hypothetical protein